LGRLRGRDTAKKKRPNLSLPAAEAGLCLRGDLLIHCL